MVVAALIYCIANTLVKLSLLALYGRLSNDRTFRTYVHIVVFICVGAGVANFVIVGYLYNLLTMLWDSVPRASGINILSFYFFGISIHIVTEFILFALPIPTLLKLDMPRRQKVGIIVLFCLGALWVLIFFSFLEGLYWDLFVTAWSDPASTAWLCLEILRLH